MPEFVNPFSGLVHRKMTTPELIRAIRLNISAEQEAVHLYLAHADATDNALARAVLIEVANEERQHIGEFLELLKRLAPDEQQFLDVGRGEVEEIAVGVTPMEASADTGGASESASSGPGLTIGPLRQTASEEVAP